MLQCSCIAVGLRQRRSLSLVHWHLCSKYCLSPRVGTARRIKVPASTTHHTPDCKRGRKQASNEGQHGYGFREPERKENFHVSPCVPVAFSKYSSKTQPYLLEPYKCSSLQASSSLHSTVDRVEKWDTCRVRPFATGIKSNFHISLQK